MARQDDIVSELADIGCQIREHLAALDELYAARLRLWMEGQHSLEPRMSQAQLAAPSGVTEGAVTQALRKVRIRAEV